MEPESPNPYRTSETTEPVSATQKPSPAPVREIIWFCLSLLLFSFLATVLYIAPGWGIVAAIFLVPPYLYILLKSIWMRVRYRPLTPREIAFTTLRAFAVSFFVVVVIPMMVTVALILLLLATCFAQLKVP